MHGLQNAIQLSEKWNKENKVQPSNFTEYAHKRIGIANYNRAEFIVRNMDHVPKICTYAATELSSKHVVQCADFIARWYKNPMPLYIRWRNIFGPMVTVRCTRRLLTEWTDAVEEFWRARERMAGQVYVKTK